MARHSNTASKSDRYEFGKESHSHCGSDVQPTSESVTVDRERLSNMIATGEIPFPEDGDIELAMAVRVRRRWILIELIARQIAAAMECTWSTQDKGE
ncbi:MAG: hypothetical protein AABP62_14845 [Planctomycetota bacterium]